jgi:L-gulonolactone oxidase
LSSQKKQWTSWNGQISHSYQELHTVHNLNQLQTRVAQASKLRVIGTGKSSSDICAGTTSLLDLSPLSAIIGLGPNPQVDSASEKSWLVEAQAGIKLGDLLNFLESRGFCLPALPDIDDISLGGAIATGSHGTGKTAKSLSDYVAGMRLVLADGSLVSLGHFPESTESDVLLGQAESKPTQSIDLDAARVSLGLFGPSYSISLYVEPLFQIALEEELCPNAIWENQWPIWQENYDFTRILFLPHTGFGWRILGKRYQGNPPFTALDPDPDIKNRRLVSQELYKKSKARPHLIAKANQELQERFFQKPIRRLGSLYRSSVSPARSGTMVLSEWTLPFADFSACFKKLRSRMERPFFPKGIHIPMDVRFFCQSQAWLANNYGADTVSLGCVCRDLNHLDTYKGFKIMEETFLEFGGRPHWAKTFQAERQTLVQLYPRFNDFVQLRRSLDPGAKFLNPYLAKLFD